MDGDRLRHAVNHVNLSTPLGLLVARVGGAHARRRHGRLTIVGGYRLEVPAAPAFTVGDVVIVRSAALDALPDRLVAHEREHAVQYAYFGGPLMLGWYGLAAGWSWLRTGDWWSRNLFERRAGLALGGYVEHPVVPWRRRLRRLTERAPVESAGDGA